MASYLYGAGRYELLSRRWWLDGDRRRPLILSRQLAGLRDRRHGLHGRGGGEIQVRRLREAVVPDGGFHRVLTSSAVGNSILFAGAYHDAESGNYHLWHREYDPYLGRFLQRDPLGEWASLNLYAYVFNNPVNAVDPTGLATGLSASQEQAAGEFWHATLDRTRGRREWGNGAPSVISRTCQSRGSTSRK